MAPPDVAPVLDVRGLTVEFSTEGGVLRAVDDVSFEIGRGEIVGLVGESGAGKSLTSEAILRLIRCPPGRVQGEVWFRGQNLLALGERALADIRGKDIAMIFQNPGASLNPVFRVGEQMLEAMAVHLPERRSALRKRVLEILGRVGIPSPQTRAR
ncbi:MAG TPA: ATP-binding cassette domain-containing protein, partial [Methylomirabilota bacterium]|nr:ATP-binding cassette domain-containing protein [Methylomirabilota bacterium]